MALFRKDGNQGQGRRAGDRNQNALVRQGQQQQPQVMRDPYQLIQRDPWQLMREMMIDPFRMFQQLAPWGDVGRQFQETAWNPSFEVRETDDAMILEADLPGARQEDLEISLVGNNLQISGKREREEERDEGMVHTFERSYGQFARSFVLPDDADPDKVSCDLKDGVLKVVVHKREGAGRRRKIQIGSGSKS